MTIVLTSEEINNHYLTIEQEKYDIGYTVTDTEIRGGYGCWTEKRYYGTMKQARRRFSNLRKKYM